MKKQIVKFVSLSSLVFLSLTGLSVNFNQGKLGFETTPQAQAQTACDTQIRNVSFTGRTSGSMTGKPNVNTNMRSNTTTSASILTTIPPNTLLTFTGWAYGQGITDIWTGNTDYRWFRVTYNGRTGWVASGVIYGNPPSAPLAPNCSTPPPVTGYYPNIETTLRNFFSNTNNTRGENWSSRTITQMWDRVGGESAQFPNLPDTHQFNTGDLWKVNMPTDVYNIYQNLSNTIFGSVRPVTGGYAYDYGYYGTYGAHSAIDMSASNGTSVKPAVTGIVVDNRGHNHNGSFNGYWIAVDELNSAGQKTGRRWWYGHLATRSVNVGSRVTAGQTVLGTVGQGHLHLGVVSTYTTYTTSMYGNENRNGSKSLGYSGAVNDVLNRTMSPLQAYWKSRNGIRE